MNDIVNKFSLIVKDFNSKNFTPALEVISALIFAFVQQNFDAGGRWDGQGTGLFSGGSSKWHPLAPSSKKNYIRKGYLLEPTLYRTGRLFNSIEVSPRGKSIVLSANSKYASIHQLGGKIKHPGGSPYIAFAGNIFFISNKKAAELVGKGRKVKYTQPHEIIMPPRPFFTLNKDDLQEIVNYFSKFFVS